MTRQLFLLVLALVAAAGCHREAAPSHIFINGRIVTVDPQFRTVEAMAIRDGHIVAVGTTDEIVKRAGSGTTRVDLGGKTVLPGLIDSHVHAPAAAMYEFEQPVPGHGKRRGRARLRPRARGDRRAGHVDHAVAGLHHAPARATVSDPRRARSGGAAASRWRFAPVRTRRLNSMALSISGIDANVQGRRRASRAASSGTARGQPTGILRNCGRHIKSAPKRTRADAERPPGRLQSCSPTTTPSASPASSTRMPISGGLELYRTLLDQKALTCRTYMAYGVDAQAPLDKIDAAIREAAASPLHQHSDMLWLRGIKVFLDGGMLTGSAYMREPWGVSQIYAIDDPTIAACCSSSPRSCIAWPSSRSRTTCSSPRTRRRCGGGRDGRRLRADQPRRLPGPRPASEHHPRHFMSAEAIAKMKALGVVANMQPAWLYLDGARCGSTSASSVSPTFSRIARCSSRA